MLDKIANIISNITDWFTPEQRAKRLREKKKNIEKEIKAIKRGVCTPEKAKRLEKLENELDKINDILTC